MEFPNKRDENIKQNISIINKYFENPQNIQLIEKYLQESKFIEIISKLGLKTELESIKEYIIQDLLGKIKGEFSIQYFWKCIEEYMKNHQLIRYENGFIDTRYRLPIKSQKSERGLKTLGMYLGQDGYEYLIKSVEKIKLNYLIMLLN